MLSYPPHRWRYGFCSPTMTTCVSHSSAGGRGMMGSLMARVEKMVDDPNRGSKLSQRVTEAEAALEETKKKWESISGSVAAEARAFHRMTNADFARGLKEHVERQLSFEREKQRVWGELLTVFEQVPSASASVD